MSRRAIFFDKDGTLVENVPHNVDPEKIKFTEGVKSALSVLKDAFQFHIVTNQPGVALGLFQEIDLTFVRNKLAEMFSAEGAELKGFHYCPHYPEGVVENHSIVCLCRKPGSLMLERAASQFSIDLSRSWMIGDILDDIEAGKRAGCRTILLDNGNETEWVMNEYRSPDYKVKNLKEAAMVIVAEEDQNV